MPGRDPLFYKKVVHANGESEEMSVGACAAWIVRWIILALIVLLLSAGSTAGTNLVHLLLRVWP